MIRIFVSSCPWIIYNTVTFFWAADLMTKDPEMSSHSLSSYRYPSIHGVQRTFQDWQIASLSFVISHGISDDPDIEHMIKNLYETCWHILSALGHRQPEHYGTVGQHNQESRLNYWATRLSIRSFACTTHSFACSRLLASLAPSAALNRLLACSLRSLPRSWEKEYDVSKLPGFVP